MNEAVLLKLKVIVERAVRPVRASLSRKKKIREELLGHVTGVFEEELLRCQDEAAALIQVEHRFGNPNEITSTLQKSISNMDRYVFLIEKLIEPRIGESLFRRAGRYGMMVFALDAILSVGLALLIFPLIDKTNQLGFALYILLLLSACFGAVCFVGTLLTKGLEYALFGTSDRSLLKASALGIVSCFIPASLPVAVALGTSLFESVSLFEYPVNLTGAMPAVLMAPWIFVMLAKQISLETRYREEWSKLEID